MCIRDSNKLNQIQKELAEVGIRINQKRPEITIEEKLSGGLEIHSNLKQDLKEATLKQIASEMGFKNAVISLKEKVTVDSLIDALSPNRTYLPALTVINKVDLNPASRQKIPEAIYVSAKNGTGFEELKEKIWEKLNLVRIYLVHPDEEPNLNNPLIMKAGQTLADVARKIGEEFAAGVKSAKIWGSGARFPGQEVSLTTPVKEGLQVRFI